MNNLKLELDLDGIHEYQQNRYPYLLIDYAEEVIPGKIANGYKILKNDEWFFKVHWPGDPNMPGMLQVEALVQMCALTILCMPGNKGQVVYLASANNLKFSKKVVPGDKLIIKTKLQSWKRGVGLCSGIGEVNNNLACKADFTLVLPILLNEYISKS
tara:strand:+ start:644 stop:1114 length:471 start_codon:yes stop_codon:yes gene_type:complete